MNKKEFYEAPKWGTRVLIVERHILDLSNPGSITDDEIVEGGDLS